MERLAAWLLVVATSDTAQQALAMSLTRIASAIWNGTTTKVMCIVAATTTAVEHKLRLNRDKIESIFHRETQMGHG